MRRSNWTPSIVPTDDQTFYLVMDDFGKRGREWREAEICIQTQLLRPGCNEAHAPR
jgi:hypothetical protein